MKNQWFMMVEAVGVGRTPHVQYQCFSELATRRGVQKATKYAEIATRTLRELQEGR